MKKLFQIACLLFIGSGAVAAARQKVVDTKINPVDGALMLYVPAGAFTMGSKDSDKDVTEREQPAHQVVLKGYWVYRNDVTVAQYRKFCKAAHRSMPGAPAWGWIDSHPMVNVSWNDAQAYCAWAGTKLPTEAQWEKAARGTDGRIYPWGNKFDKSKCWTSENDATRTKPVGSFPNGASPYGCLDMAGNVWEWCQDLCVYKFPKRYRLHSIQRKLGDNQYKTTPVIYTQNSPPEIFRALRGGAWTYSANDCRTISRNASTQTDKSTFIGFRCVVPES
jgi:formylglycine-generating enzyme required for sulfatase activity